jgi:hypothetical protein
MRDVSKFFDRESLVDCMNELYKCNIKGKLYRLLFQMNKNTKISVQTPVGITEESDTGEGVGQGTLEGGLVSAVSLDKGVNDFFCESEYEVNYGEVALQPLLYQDDVARLSTDLESVQMGNTRMEALAETKLLDYNLDKSCFVVIGRKKSRQEIQVQLESQPIQLCGRNMKQEEHAKYLGDWLSCLGLSASVDTTVMKRKGLVVKSIYEIRSVVDDCRSQVCGGLTAGLDIWELAVLPILLYNAECWQEISEETTQHLENLQKKFYKCLFAVGSGCPTTALYVETGGIMIKYRILMKKLMFLHHLSTLPNDTLAREIFEVQKKLNLPGLFQECQEFMMKFDITKVENFSPIQWKNLVKNKIEEMNKIDILNQMKKSKKMKFEEYVTKDFKRQAYLTSLNLSDARMRFKINASMTPTVKMNFPSDEDFASQLWSCSGCGNSDLGYELAGSRDTQQHIMICPGYEELRENKNLEDDRDLVKYFSQVIKRRKDLDNA